MNESRDLNAAARPRGGPVESDEAADEQWLSQHLRRVYLLIYHIVGNAADAQDLTQEAFIKVLQRREQLRDQAKAAHWLSRIAANTAIDFLRRHARRAAVPIEESMDAPATRSDDSAEQRLLAGERSRMLQDGLARLTERERVALVLRDVEDLPAREVARVLNCGAATVRSHIANARLKFRKYLEGRME
jgi:RNA polymerase sigma-70 factor (ECF subfamily)